jgi:hypothetical protein
VKFFFIYKSLAHPELAGNYVQPFTLEERLAHAQQADRQLGGMIPWIVDGMDNDLKHALGNRPNSEFVVDPEGKIVSKRQWSHPAEVRKELESFVGPVEPITKEEDIQLKITEPLKSAAARGVIPRLHRTRMQALAVTPRVDPDGSPFFAKLRAEADNRLLMKGSGRLYLGFHLDPFHGAHWNNLTKPLSFELSFSKNVSIAQRHGEARTVAAVSDSDPREFLLDVESWPEGETIQLTVTYFACVGEESCHSVRQEYTLRRERDQDAGNARGEGAGYWEEDEFAEQLISGDTDKDGKLNKTEVRGLILPHFESLDQNKDGLLEISELKQVTDWLNSHHQPGRPQNLLKSIP